MSRRRKMQHALLLHYRCYGRRHTLEPQWYSLAFKTKTAITRPADRFVWIDEGRTKPGGWTVEYDKPAWNAPPPCRHENGTTWSFADGHIEYHKWSNKQTIEVCDTVIFASPGFSWNPDQPCNEDLEWVQKRAWGKLGYNPDDYDCTKN